MPHLCEDRRFAHIKIPVQATVGVPGAARGEDPVQAADAFRRRNLQPPHAAPQVHHGSAHRHAVPGGDRSRRPDGLGRLVPIAVAHLIDAPVELDGPTQTAGPLVVEHAHHIARLGLLRTPPADHVGGHVVHHPIGAAVVVPVGAVRDHEGDVLHGRGAGNGDAEEASAQRGHGRAQGEAVRRGGSRRPIGIGRQAPVPRVRIQQAPMETGLGGVVGKTACHRVVCDGQGLADKGLGWRQGDHLGVDAERHGKGGKKDGAAHECDSRWSNVEGKVGKARPAAAALLLKSRDPPHPPGGPSQRTPGARFSTDSRLRGNDSFKSRCCAQQRSRSSLGISPQSTKRAIPAKTGISFLHGFPLLRE